MKTCERTGKVTYRDPFAAGKALEKAKRSPSPNRREQALYACRHCGGWHLTSKTRRAA